MKGVLLTTIIAIFSLQVMAKKKDIPTTIYQIIPNEGQFHPNAKFEIEIPNGLLFLEENQFTYHFYDAALLNQLHHGEYTGDSNQISLQHHAYQVKFMGASSHEVLPSKKRSNYFNYYRGNNKNNWAAHVPSYEEVTYNELYPGIDLKMYAHPKSGLKYDLIVHPNGNVNDIKIDYQGVDRIFIKNGKLYVITSLTENWEEKPYAYQIVNGQQKKVSCKYVLKGTVLSYEFPNGYDSSIPLIIDPVLVFSSFTGATSNNFGYTATYDKFGFLYSGSSSFNVGYPTTLGAYQTTWAGGTGGSTIGIPSLTGTDMAISKWDTSGTSLIYSTYLGGTSDELPHSLVVTEFHELYVMGSTGSTDFPVTSGAFDTSFNVSPTGPSPINMLNGLGVFYLNGADITITKFDSSGSNLEASTFLGGTKIDGLNIGTNKFNYADEVRGEIDLDHSGKVLVATCTTSDDNPVTSNGFQNTKLGVGANNLDGIIYKLNHNLSALEWTNYLGGTLDDAAYSIAINDSNEVYVTGGTRSADFQVTPTAYDTSFNGGNDGFVMHISENGNTLISSSFYGTSAYDQTYFVELDGQKNVYLYGQTAGPSGDLISNAGYSNALGGQLVAKLTPAIDSVVWATRFGSGDGNPDISPTAFLVDVCNAIYISGWGSPILNGGLSTNGLDTAGGPIQGTTDGADFYVMVLSDDASTLNYATFFGGSAQEHVDGGTSRFDRKGKVYQAVCAGCNGTSDFPTHPNPGAVSNTNGAAPTGCNLAVFKMDFLLPIVIADFDAPTTGCAPFNVNFTNISLQQSATTFFWDFGDGSTSTQFAPSHTYQNAGVYTVTLVVNDAATCNLNDTLQRTITVLNNSNQTLPDAIMCNSIGVQIGIPQNNDPNLSIQWIPSIGLSDTAITNPIASPTQTTGYMLILNNGVCFDTLTQTVLKDTINTQIFGDTSVCSYLAPFLLTSNSYGNVSQYIWSNLPNFSDTLNSSLADSQVWVNPVDSLNYFYLQVTNALGCVATDSFKMVLKDLQNPIVASFTHPGTGCAPYSVPFQNTTDSLSSTTYFWDLGNGSTSTNSNPTSLYSQPGFYTVTLVAYDSSICPQTDTFQLTFQVRSDSSYTLNEYACYNQETPIGIQADTVPGTTYQWTPTTGLSDPFIHNPTTNITTNTSYLLVVNHVCTDSVTVNVTVDSIFAVTDSVKILCSDNLTVQLLGNSFGTSVNFVWSSNNQFTDTLNNLADSTVIISNVVHNSYYYFGVETAAGCFEFDSTLLIISDQTIQLSPDSLICQDDSLWIMAQNSYPANAMDYFWTPSNQIISPADSSAILVAPSTTTTYYLTAVNDSGCVFSDSVVVSVSGLSPQNVLATSQNDSIINGFSTTLQVTPNSGYSYSWAPSQSLSHPNNSVTSASPTTTTTYTVTVTEPQNTSCAYTSSVTVVVYEINCGEPDIFIPNAFSPNGDGENDSFQLRGKVLQQVDIQIFNRWGELVFETTDLTQPWDGKYNGTLVDPAVYVYQLTATCIDGATFSKKGNITVIR